MIRRKLTTIALFTFAALADAQGAPPARKELPHGECLRPDIINEWNIVDARTITVRNGPHHFVVRTTVACPRADLGGGLVFRPSRSDRYVGGGRICGGIDEQVVRRSDPPCTIESVRPISKAQFDALKKKANSSGVNATGGRSRGR
jgi:hypothetical protein